MQSTFAQDKEGKNINMKLCRTQNEITMIKIILLAYLSLLEKFFDLYVSQFDIMWELFSGELYFIEVSGNIPHACSVHSMGRHRTWEKWKKREVRGKKKKKFEFLFLWIGKRFLEENFFLWKGRNTKLKVIHINIKAALSKKLLVRHVGDNFIGSFCVFCSLKIQAFLKSIKRLLFIRDAQ